MTHIDYSQRPSQIIDSVRRPATRPVGAREQPIGQPPQQRTRSDVHVQPPSKRRWRLPLWAQLLLGIPLFFTASFAIQSPPIGHLLILGYGVVAVVWRIPSRTTFSLAVVAMVATIVLLVTRGYLPLAHILASYTFLFLVVGVITLSRELKKEGGRLYSYRPNR